MDETATATTVADFAKDLTLGVAKEVAITAAGIATAFVILGAAGTIVKKVQDRKAAKNIETPKN